LQELYVGNNSQTLLVTCRLPSDMFSVWLRWQFPAIVQKNVCDLTRTWRVIPNTVHLKSLHSGKFRRMGKLYFFKTSLLFTEAYCIHFCIQFFWINEL